MKKKKILIVVLIMVLGFLFIKPVDTYAYKKINQSNTTIKHSLAKGQKGKKNNNDSKKKPSPYLKEYNCDSFLGNPKNEDDFAWLLQEIFNVVKYVGPFLLLVLSSIDFAKTIIQNDDESMQKAQKRLFTRIILVLLLFFIPDLVMVIMGIFGIVTTDPTCGIE